jgi:hypothetical protein
LRPFGVTGFCHQLFGLADIVLPFRPRQAVFDIVVDPVAVDPPQPVAFGLVYRIAVDREAHRLAHPLVVKRAFRVLKTWKF